MLKYLYSNSSQSCCDESLRLEAQLTSEGKCPLLLSSRHLGKLQLMEIPAILEHEALIVDEAQLCKKSQAQFLRFLSKRHGLTIICCGLRENEQEEPFEGSSFLLAWADEINAIRTSPQVETADCDSGEETIPPLLAEFLDARSSRERLKLFSDNRHRMDNDMLDTIAAVLDIEVPEGSLEKRADDIQGCLETIVKYEIERR
jgi:hypothetical protein